MSKHNVNRRQFLKAAGLTLSGVVLASSAPAATSAPVVAATSAPVVAATSAPVVEAAPTTAPAAVGSYQGKFVIMSNQSDTLKIQPWIDKLKVAFPGVDFDFHMLTSPKYVELFTAAEVAGDQIDYMDLDGQDLRRYALGGKLMDLSSLTYLDRFRPSGKATYTVNGKLWALPVGGIGGVSYLFNQKIFDKVGYTKEPETYDDIKQLAAELKKIGVACYAHEGKDIYKWPEVEFWAHGQTSGNKSKENTFKVLTGDMKFTDPEYVAALAVPYQFAQDGLFIDGVNSLDSDGAWLAFSQGKSAFWCSNINQMTVYRSGSYPLLDMNVTRPPRVVSDASIIRQTNGFTGNADGIYSKIAPERQDLAFKVLDWWSGDESCKFWASLAGAPVATNVNVQASTDPIALKYGKESSDTQVTFLDWFWPPEVTNAFQTNIQALVAGPKKPDAAAADIQAVLDGLFKNGYKFSS